ncbi:hypothetical protein [Neptunomonas marina]|uniref:Uncharacterized protein n=1 Tax=Neptunomonas marina TaxID=1815562 RepID=A0A437Q8Z6_9GAMM|nr:hypothetical protein [Neptunomonas marina]RVU31051.1 hypothetical protein EOE65_08565 [Neptunomonas marina]
MHQSRSLKDENSGNESQIWMALSDWDLNSELESELADKIQSAFESADQDTLIYKGSLPTLSHRQYVRKVSREPLNLTAHVRRFYLAMVCGDKDNTVGALIDLVIILRYRGRALVERLISEAEQLIGPETTEQLKEIAQAKSVNRVLSLDVSRSVLVNGCSLPMAYKKKDV